MMERYITSQTLLGEPRARRELGRYGAMRLLTELCSNRGIAWCCMKHALAEAMLQRREQLELTVVAAAERAGVARSTWHAIEGATRDRLAIATSSRIDRALDWLPGTAQRLFRGP